MSQGFYIGSLRLPHQLAQEARELAKSQETSLAKLVQVAIKEYVEKHRVPRVLLLRNGVTSVVTVLRKDGEPEVVSQFFVGQSASEDEVRKEVVSRTGISVFTLEELS